MSSELNLSGETALDNPEPAVKTRAFNLDDTQEHNPWDFGGEKAPEKPSPPVSTRPFNPEEDREATRGDLARGLLWLLTFAIGGVLVFVGLGRLEGSVLTQSVFPSLIALAGTALGFYFGSQAAKPPDSAQSDK